MPARNTLYNTLYNTLHALCTLVMLFALFGLSAGDASARGRGRPHINRSGPASQGSFSRTPNTYRRPPVAPDPRPPRAPDPGPDRPHQRGPDPGFDPGPDPGFDPGPDPGFDPGPGPGDNVAPDRVREERIDRRDDRHDRARRRRAWRHGTQLSYVEWNDYDCGNHEVVADGDNLFECEGTWFIQTYYGGEVVYTVTDAPSEY